MLLPSIGIIMSSQINPEDSLEEQQTDDETDAEPSEQLDSDDSGEEDELANVTLNDIDRDSLSPEMQSAYDDLVGQRDNLNQGFTQARQSSAASLADAERWQMIEEDPQLAKVLTDAIYRRDNGLPLEWDGSEPKEKEQEELPNQETNPEGYLRGLMRQEMREALGDVIPSLRDEIGTVSNHVKGQQANLEFANLVTKYPAVESLGLNKLNAIRNRYTSSNGGAMPLEQALHLAAMNDSTLLAQGDKTASGKSADKKSTKVEKPSGSKTGRDVLDLPDGIVGLRKAAKATEADGKSVKDRLRETMDKIRGQGEAE